VGIDQMIVVEIHMAGVGPSSEEHHKVERLAS